MNPNPPFQGRGFGFAPVHGYYQGGTSTLAWVTFALVLLLVLTVFALLVARFASGGRRGRSAERIDGVQRRHVGTDILAAAGGSR